MDPKPSRGSGGEHCTTRTQFCTLERASQFEEAFPDIIATFRRGKEQKLKRKCKCVLTYAYNYSYNYYTCMYNVILLA